MCRQFQLAGEDALPDVHWHHVIRADIRGTAIANKALEEMSDETIHQVVLTCSPAYSLRRSLGDDRTPPCCHPVAGTACKISFPPPKRHATVRHCSLGGIVLRTVIHAESDNGEQFIEVAEWSFF
jgi:hypothetical protein